MLSAVFFFFFKTLGISYDTLFPRKVFLSSFFAYSEKTFKSFWEVDESYQVKEGATVLEATHHIYSLGG